MKQKLQCILLIDDDHGSNFLNQIIIEEANCAVHIIAKQKAKDALHYLADSALPTSKTTVLPCPDLIFLDIYMPAMDGWDFLTEFKGLKNKLPHAPVIVLHTASPNPKDIIKAQHIPEISCIQPKPLTPEIIHSVVANYFPHYF